jgi:hypothetical protein
MAKSNSIGKRPDVTTRRGFIGAIGAAAAASAPAKRPGVSLVDGPTLENPDAPTSPYSALVALQGVHPTTAERRALDAGAAFYARAVKEIATTLRPRFEAGELRDWRPGDLARWPGPYEAQNWGDMPPVLRIEKECAYRFTNHSLHAFLVLAYSPRGRPLYASPLEDGAACRAQEVMAKDIIAYAFAQGWLQRGARVRSRWARRRSA